MYLLRVLYQFPPLYSSVDGILLRVSCIFCCRWHKKRAKAEDSLELEPLVCRETERCESLKSLPIFGQEKGQKYSLFIGQDHNVFIINTTFI